MSVIKRVRTTMERHLYCLLVLATLASASVPSSAIVNDVQSTRQQRSFKVPEVISSLFGGKEEPPIPHLGAHPIWKVHKYHGISLQPVHLPEEHIPSGHPIPPTHHGEPPSIVNVPDAYHAPVEIISPPSHEYGVPHGPYPEPQDHAGPYPPPSLPTGPYPPAAHHPVLYNAHLSAEEPRGPQSEFGSHFLDLQSMLPPELVHSMQNFIATPEGESKLGALLGIAESAQKLKASAAHSIQGVFQKLLGGAGGSSDIALESGTYTDVPHTYPAPQGILNTIRAIGTGVSGKPLPPLPELHPLPKVPGLQELPPTPGLPHINLPEINHLSGKHAGNYVSFSIPHGHEEQTSFVVPEHAPEPYHAPIPAPSYSVPEIPSTSYGVPIGPSYPYPQTHGDAVGHFSEPRPSYQLPPEQSSASSETREQIESNDNQPKEEVNQKLPVPLKTTKLYRVHESQPFHAEDSMRSYLPPDHPAYQPQDQLSGNDSICYATYPAYNDDDLSGDSGNNVSQESEAQ